MVPLANTGGAADADVGKTTFADAVANSGMSSEDYRNGKLYSCAPPTGASIVRLERPRECHRHAEATNMTEGIAVIFKQNIAPYVFNVTLYYKEISVITIWQAFSTPQITNQYVTRVPVPIQEIAGDIDKRGECSSLASYKRNQIEFVAYDDDASEEMKPLVPSLLRSHLSRTFHTTNMTKRRSVVWGYRSTTTVDCIVEYLQARSVYPYEYFGLATGDTVEISPFYTHDARKKRRHNVYAQERFVEMDDYQTRDPGTKVVAPPKRRNFLIDESFTLAWDAVEERDETCTLTKWVEVPEAVRVSYDNSYHFSFKDLTLTLVSDKTTFNLSRLHLVDCVPKDAQEAIDKIYKEKYAASHVKSGEIEYYLGRGGFLIAYQKILSNSLAELYLNEARRDNVSAVVETEKAAARAKRAAGGGRGVSTGTSLITDKDGDRIQTHSAATFAMLQFAYDKIQAHVNTLVGNLLQAWCELQNRQLVVWQEVKKLNPGGVMTSILGQPVSARLLGDVIAVSRCVEVPIDNVVMQNSMRVPGEPTMCYTRPVLVFEYAASGGAGDGPANVSASALRVQGQLGENNELLHGRELVELCKLNHRRYFLFGTEYLLYEDYTFVRQVNASEIEEVSTFVSLDMTLLEDLEFVPIDVYTREELRDTGVLDYNEVMRYNNLHMKMFRDIDRKITLDSNIEIFKAIANFFQNTLGPVGKVLGTLVMNVAGAVVSTVSGVASFLSNPFAALGIGIAILVCIVLGLLAFRYIMYLRANPIRALYPETTKIVESSTYSNPTNDKAAMDMAQQVVRCLAQLAGEEEKIAKRRRKESRAKLKSKLRSLVGRKRAPRSSPYDERYLLSRGSDDEYEDDL